MISGKPRPLSLSWAAVTSSGRLHPAGPEAGSLRATVPREDSIRQNVWFWETETQSDFTNSVSILPVQSSGLRNIPATRLSVFSIRAEKKLRLGKDKAARMTGPSCLQRVDPTGPRPGLSRALQMVAFLGGRPSNSSLPHYCLSTLTLETVIPRVGVWWPLNDVRWATWAGPSSNTSVPPCQLPGRLRLC